jgi:hypothetical protein
MATFAAPDIALKAVHSGSQSNQAVYHGAVTPTAGATADIYRPLRLPAGCRPFMVTFRNGDLDTNVTPTIVCKVGYSYVDGTAAPSGADTAFAAAGQTFLQSATAVGGGTQFMVKPFAVAKEAYLELVLGTGSATFASAEVAAVVEAEGSIGPA